MAGHTTHQRWIVATAKRVQRAKIVATNPTDARIRRVCAPSTVHSNRTRLTGGSTGNVVRRKAGGNAFNDFQSSVFGWMFGIRRVI